MNKKEENNKILIRKHKKQMKQMANQYQSQLQQQNDLKYEQKSDYKDFNDDYESEKINKFQSTSTFYNSIKLKLKQKNQNEFYLNQFSNQQLNNYHNFQSSNDNIYKNTHYKLSPNDLKPNNNVINDSQFQQNNYLSNKNKFLFKIKQGKSHQIEKVKMNKFFQSASQQIRDFYSNNKKYTNIISDYDQVNFCLEEVQDKIQCYRYEMGVILKQIQQQFREILSRLMDENIKQVNKIREEKEKERQQRIDQMCKIEEEKIGFQNYIKKIANLQDIQESEFNIYKIDNEARKEELLLLHELLKKNKLQQIQQLDDLNENQQENNKDPSIKMFSHLMEMKGTIIDLEGESIITGKQIETMEGLLRKMLQSKKKNVATQLDEIELQADTKFDNFYKEVIQKSNNNIELLEVNENNDDIEKISKINGENWNLPKPIIVFLENCMKSNDSSRVLPYQYFKNIIYDIYRMRLSFANQIQTHLFNQYITMNQFIILYFINVIFLLNQFMLIQNFQTYKLRRLAEIKMLEFLVSLKYYCKIWPRAANFAYLLNICKYQNYTKYEINFEYNFDIYVQQFFLHMFQIFEKESKYMMEHNEGYQLLDKQRIEVIAKDILFYQDDSNKKKLAAKMQRLLKKIEIKPKHEFEGIDIDKMMEYALEDFLEFRRQKFKQIQKNYQKINEKVNGIFSIEDISNIFENISNQISPLKDYKFPGFFQILRLFVHSLTSGNNNYHISSKEFLSSVQKFGLDSPYPFCYQPVSLENYYDNSQYTMIKKNIGQKQDLQFQQSQELLQQNIQQIKQNNESSNKIQRQICQEKLNENIDDQTILQKFQENSLSVISSHFSILRELKLYVDQFKQSIISEQDQDIIKLHQENILQVLVNGCKFLSYPILNKF